MLLKHTEVPRGEGSLMYRGEHCSQKWQACTCSCMVTHSCKITVFLLFFFPFYLTKEMQEMFLGR